MKFIDLTNKTFNNWTVLEKGSYSSDGHIFWKCKCTCGLIKEVLGKTLRNGNSTGCRQCQVNRCFRTHGMSRSPTNKVWCGMNARCHNPKDTGYKWYGAKGVTVCERWRNNFLNFLEDMGERPDGKSIDRIDNSKGYEPHNCKWSTLKEQNWNKISCVKIGDIYHTWKILETIPEGYKATAICINCKRTVTRTTRDLKDINRKCHCPSLS